MFFVCLLVNEIRDVVVPALAESLSEGDIRWEKAVGDAIKEDEVIGEVETDKVSLFEFVIKSNFFLTKDFGSNSLTGFWCY